MRCFAAALQGWFIFSLWTRAAPALSRCLIVYSLFCVCVFCFACPRGVLCTCLNFISFAFRQDLSFVRIVVRAEPCSQGPVFTWHNDRQCLRPLNEAPCPSSRQDGDAISTASYIVLPILSLLIFSKLYLFLIFRDYFPQNGSHTFPSPSILYLLCKSSTIPWDPPFRSPLPSPEPSHLPHCPFLHGPTPPCQHPKSATTLSWELHFPQSSCVTLSKAGIHQCTLSHRFLLKTD